MPFSIFTKLIVKRPLSFHHVIKFDSTLGNLKFVNKGCKEPIFGMALPIMMLNDDINVSPEYSEYLAKSKGFAPVKTRGKGLHTKQEVEIAVERLNMRRARKASRHDFFIQQCPRGSSEGYGVTLEVPDELVFKSLNVGAGVTLEVPDNPSDYSSSSSSASEFGVEEISSDEAEVIEKNNNAKIIDAKKDTKYQVAEEQGAEKHLGNEELGAD
ncbi:hypothetical protein Tco_1312994 [Tanacetum coccineum]